MYFQSLFSFVFLLFALEAESSPLIMTRSTSTCVAADVKSIKTVVAKPTYFCKWWQQETRSTGPFIELSSSQVYAACKCISPITSTTKNKRAESTPKPISIRTQSSASCSKEISALFTEPTHSCLFYNTAARTSSPFESYTAKQLLQVCECVLGTTTTSISKKSSSTIEPSSSQKMTSTKTSSTTKTSLSSTKVSASTRVHSSSKRVSSSSKEFISTARSPSSSTKKISSSTMTITTSPKASPTVKATSTVDTSTLFNIVTTSSKSSKASSSLIKSSIFSSYESTSTSESSSSSTKTISTGLARGFAPASKVSSVADPSTVSTKPSTSMVRGDLMPTPWVHTTAVQSSSETASPSTTRVVSSSPSATDVTTSAETTPTIEGGTGSTGASETVKSDTVPEAMISSDASQTTSSSLASPSSTMVMSSSTTDVSSSTITEATSSTTETPMSRGS